MSNYVQLDVWFQEDKLSALSSVLVEQGTTVEKRMQGVLLDMYEALVCQRQYEIVRKRRRNFVVFRRGWVTKSAAALLKKSVHDLLFLTHKFFAFFQPVILILNKDI